VRLSTHSDLALLPSVRPNRRRFLSPIRRRLMCCAALSRLLKNCQFSRRLRRLSSERPLFECWHLICSLSNERS
jgi:hypothetical protein